MASFEETGAGEYAGLFRELTEEPIITKDTEDEDVPKVPKIKAKPDISLADGMPLPKYLRNDFPDSLFGKLIHEIDPFYDNKNTFVVIGTNWVIHRFSTLKSFYLLTPLNRLRWFAIRTVTHWIFRFFMIITVIAYAMFYTFMEMIAWHMPFLMIFTIEMNLKIIARGFLMHPFSYLRNPWNWIDFMLTQIGMTLSFVAHNLHPIHSLRILRLIHFFTHSRLSCSWMFRSLLRMKDPFLYGAFLFFFFTIYSQQFMAGHLSQRCIKETWVPIQPIKYHNVTYVIPLGVTNENATEPQFVTLDYVCGNYSGSRACPDGFICKETSENPDYGYTSFDNFPMAAVSIMRLMARDYWDGLYMQIHSALGPREFLFVLTVIVYGGLYYVNLLLAYIAVGITELLQILEGKKPEKKKKENKSVDRHASEKEKAHNGIDEKDMAQVVDFPLVNIDAPNRTEEAGDDAINEVKHGEYRPRRGVFSKFCIPLMDRFCDWNCCSCWVGLRRKLTAVVESIYFNVFIGLCIVTNIVMLAIYHHGISMETYHVIRIAGIVFGLVFIVEAILKILALSPRHYFKDSMNLLDFFIVVDIIIDPILEHPGFWQGTLRVLRVFRIFRTGRWWPFFNDLAHVCKTNFWALCVVAFTFSTMGSGIFRWYDDRDMPQSRWHFLTGWNSLLTVFRILCGEWIESLWDCLPGSSGSYCFPYFFMVVFVGNLTLFTLFITMLAVVLNSNDLSETAPVSDRNFISIIKNFFSLSRCSRFRQPKPSLEAQTSGKSQQELFDMSADEEAKISGAAQLTFGEDAVSPCCCDSCYKFLPCCGSPYKVSSTVASATANNTSFWRTWEGIRSRSLHVIHNKYFEYGMTTFIVLSCFTQAWYDLGYDYFYVDIISVVTHYLVIIFYTLEISLQMLGLGCKNYFTDGWHSFDFIVTFLHITSMLSSMFIDLPIVFRPLKLIPRLKRLRAVVSATLYKLASLVDVLLACGIIWLVFAIFGVHYFGGKFYSCVSDGRLSVDEVYFKDDCMTMAVNSSNITWELAEFHFNDISEAFVSLLHVAILKGWLTILYNAVDSRHIDGQPFREVNMPSSLYFFAFFIFGVLCCFTFLLATFIRKINEQRKQISIGLLFEGDSKVGGYIEILMTEDQRKEFARKKRSFFISPVKVSPCPEWWPRRVAYRIVFSSKFKLLVILVTTFNAIGLALITLQASKLMATAIFDIDLVFFLVFALEVLLRTAAFGRNFFARHWNIYDCVVLVASVFVYALHPLFYAYVPSPLLFGLLRIIRLVRWLKWVRRIASRLMLYLVALNNVALLLFVIILEYGSMAFFIYQYDPLIPGHTDHLEFKPFGTALMCITMLGFGSSLDVVVDNYEGSRWFIFSFMALFYLIVMKAGAILFLEHYHLLDEKRRLGLTDDALENYETAWKILDPNATGYISYGDLSEFLHAMLPPLQLCHPNQDDIAALDVPIYKDDNVAFDDVLLALVARLDDRGKIDRTFESHSRDDVISSTLKRKLESEVNCVEQELGED